MKIILDEFRTLLTYTRNLQFEEEPDYSYIRGLFEEVFNRSDFTYDFIFDWNFRKSKHIVYPQSQILIRNQLDPR